MDKSLRQIVEGIHHLEQRIGATDSELVGLFTQARESRREAAEAEEAAEAAASASASASASAATTRDGGRPARRLQLLGGRPADNPKD